MTMRSVGAKSHIAGYYLKFFIRPQIHLMFFIFSTMAPNKEGAEEEADEDEILDAFLKDEKAKQRNSMIEILRFVGAICI